MTNEEIIALIQYDICLGCDYKYDVGNYECKRCHFGAAIAALKSEPCEDAVSREAVMKLKSHKPEYGDMIYAFDVELLPPVTPKQRLCKDCKFFEYDSIAKVDGIPLIVAHEICNKWGDGCKTKEDGYCFLFEPKMEGESE